MHVLDARNEWGIKTKPTCPAKTIVQTQFSVAFVLWHRAQHIWFYWDTHYDISNCYKVQNHGDNGLVDRTGFIIKQIPVRLFRVSDTIGRHHVPTFLITDRIIFHMGLTEDSIVFVCAVFGFVFLFWLAVIDRVA